uniref:Uncharacterized protein n=1 Tax=Rhizochromulina marina TaxID=1034831 RepID=A0A7S2S731_9STRA
MSDGFRVQLLDLRQRLQDAEARGESSEADAKALEEKIGAMETSTTTLQESLRGLSAEKETLTLRLEEKHTAIEDLVRDAAAKDADMARRMEELSGQKARAEEHVTALSRDKARLDEELQAERDRNHSAEEQAAGEAASAAQRESVLASALRAAEAKVSELSGKKAVLEENHRCEVAKLEADCVQAQAETKAAAERLLAVEASQEALQRELAQLRAEKARIEQQLEEELERSRSSSKAGAVANAVSQLLVAEASRNQTQEELDRLQQGNGSSSSEGQGDEGAAEEEGGGGEEPTEASSSSNTAHEEGCSCGGDGDKLKACEEREADLKKELARALKEKNEALERLQQALNGGDHAIATRAIRVEDASGQQQPTASAAQLITCIHDLTRENESLGKHRENQTKVIVELTQSVEEADSYLRLSWGVIGVFLFVVLLWVRWFYLFDVAWLHPMRKENVTLCAADECDVAVSGLSLEGRLLVGENLTVRAFQCGGRQCGEVSRAASMVRSLSGGGAGDPSYTALVGAWTVERATVSSSKRQHSAQQSQMLLDAQQQVQHLQESMDQKQQAQIQQLDDLRQQLHDQQKQHVSELARQENLEQDKQRQLQEAQQQLQKVQKEHQAELQKLNKAHAQELQQQGQQLQAQQRQHAQELQQQDQQLQAQLKQQSQQLDLQVKLQDQSAAHAKELGKLRDELQAEQKAHIQELVDQEQLRQSKQHQLQEVEQQMQQVVKQHTVELQQQEKQFKQQIQVLEQVDNKKQAQLSELERKLKDQDKKLKEEQAKKAKPCPAANCPKPPPVAKKQRTNEIQTAALMRNGSTFWLNRGSDEAPDLRFLVLGSLASLALSLASKAHRFALFLPWGAAAGAATLAPVSSLIPAAFSASASPAASTAAGTIVVRPAVVWLQRFAGVILPATLGWCGQVTAGLVLASTVALVSDQGAGSGEPADQSSPLPFPPSPSPAPSPPQEERERPRVRDFSRTAPMSYRGGVAFPSDENGLGQRVQVALGPLVAVAQTVVSWARRLFHSGPFKVPETEDARRV